MWIYLLINEHSGNGAGLKKAREVMEILQEKNISFEVLKTLYPFHERILIHDLLKKNQLIPWPKENEDRPFPLLIVISGDGTLHEVINTIQNPNIPVAFIPAKNSDFAQTIGLSSKTREAVEQILTAQKPTAVNTLYYKDLISDASGVCLSNFGIGLDADIDNYVYKMKQKRRFARRSFQLFGRMMTVFRDIFFRNGFPIMLDIKGQRLYFNHTFLCTISNAPYSVGKFSISSTSNVYKKEFDLVVIEKQPWSQLIKIAFLLWRNRHFNSPDVHHYKTDTIHLLSTVPQRVQFDGQVWEKQPFDLYFTAGSQYIWINNKK